MGRRRKGSDQDPTNKDSLAAALARWDTAQNWMRKDPDPGDHNVSPAGAPTASTPTPPPSQPPPPGQPNSHIGWGHNPPPAAAQADWQPVNDPPIHPSGVWIPEQPPPTQAPPPAAPPPPQSATPEPPPPVQSWEAPSAPTAVPLADSWDALLAGGPSMSYPQKGGNTFQSNATNDPVEAEFTVDQHVTPVVDQEFSAPNGSNADAPDRAVQQSTSYASTRPASPPAPAVGDISFPPDGSAQLSDEPSAEMASDDAADVQRPRHSDNAEFVSPNVEQPIVESVMSESVTEPVVEPPSEKPNPANPIWSPREESPISAASHEPDISELMPSAPAPPEPTGSPEASAHQPITETPSPVAHEAPWSPTQTESFDEPHQEPPTAPLNPEPPSYFPPPPPPGQQQFYGWTPPSGQTPPPVDYQQNYQQQPQPSQQFYPGQPQYFQPPVPQAPPAQQFPPPPPHQPQPAPSQPPPVPPQSQQAPNPTEAAQHEPGSLAPGVDELTSQALLRARNRQPQSGWRKAVYTLSAHTVNPGEAASDVERRELMQRAMASVQGCYRIAVISLKGGVGKTTMTVCLGATLASLRGDRVIAVDANPDRGTLSGKIPLETVATVRNLLNDANDVEKYSDVRRYTSQSPDRLEVLASESDPAVSIAFSEDDYRVVAGILERFYNVVLTDCGTGLLHSAMSGVLALANQLIVVSSGSVDGARSASATLDWLDAHGHSSLVAGSVAVINSVRPKSGGVDLDRLEEHFASRCRAVTRIPYDPHLEEGAEVDLAELKETTRLALLGLAAQVADGFPARSQTTRAPIHQSMGGLG